MNKLVIFDLDGTLLDTLGDICAAVNFSLGQVGRPLRTREEVYTFIGNGSRRLIDYALGDEPDEKLSQRSLDIYCKYYAEHYCDHTYPYAGIVECVDELIARGVTCAVITNKMQDVSSALCQRYFGERFVRVIGDTKGAPRKPDPTKVFALMAELDCREAVFVGDSYVDVTTAKNAGLPCVALTWGFNTRAQLEAAGADIYADSSEELMEHLCRLLNIKKG